MVLHCSSVRLNSKHGPRCRIKAQAPGRLGVQAMKPGDTSRHTGCILPLPPHLPLLACCSPLRAIPYPSSLLVFPIVHLGVVQDLLLICHVIVIVSLRREQAAGRRGRHGYLQRGTLWGKAHARTHARTRARTGKEGGRIEMHHSRAFISQDLTHSHFSSPRHSPSFFFAMRPTRDPLASNEVDRRLGPAASKEASGSL